MAFEVLLTAHDIRDGSIFNDGVVASLGTGPLEMEVLAVLGDAMPWNKGWNCQRDIFFMPSKNTAATRQGLQQRNRNTGEHVDSYTYNNNSNQRPQGDFNGIDFSTVFKRPATNDQFRQFKLEKGGNFSGAHAQSNFDSVNKEGACFDGITWHHFETGSPGAQQAWSHGPQVNDAHLIDNSINGAASLRDVATDGRNWYWLREHPGGAGYRILYREIGCGFRMAAVETFLDRIPFSYDHCRCMTCDGRYLYVGWVGSSISTGLGDYGEPP